MPPKKPKDKVVIVPSNQGEMGAVILGFASALLACNVRKPTEDASEEACATAGAAAAGAAAEEPPTKKARPPPTKFLVFSGDTRITGQHALQLRQASRLLDTSADNWEVSRLLQGYVTLARSQLNDLDPSISAEAAVKDCLRRGLRDARFTYRLVQWDGMPDVESLMAAARV